MRILVLDAAGTRCLAAVMVDGAVCAQCVRDESRGIAALLPQMVQDVLAEARVTAQALDAVAVTVGPGGFTGIRTALALAHGIGQAAGVQVVGVSVGEAIAALLSQDRPLWCALDSRRGQVFLERDGHVEGFGLDDLPVPTKATLIAGNAAPLVINTLLARGAPVQPAPGAQMAEPLGIARAAQARLTGRLGARAAQPLYVDPPEAKLPRDVRPAPV